MVANKLFIGIGGTLTAAALTIGAVSASGGGPISSDSDDVQTEEASPTPVEVEEDEVEEEDSDDVDEEEDNVETQDEGDEDASAGNQKIAEAIAEEFDTTPDEVLALHDGGIGFGAIFKLYLIARANGMTVGDLLSQVDEDGGGIAFGKLKKTLTEEEMAIFEDGPKNLGELVSGSNHDDDDDSDDAGEDDEGETSRGGDRGNGKSKGHDQKD